MSAYKLALGTFVPLGENPAPVAAAWRIYEDGTEEFDHECREPKSSDFQDGRSANGCWTENGIHYEQVCGSSGVYIVETDIATGEVIRDSRPWQMKV